MVYGVPSCAGFRLFWVFGVLSDCDVKDCSGCGGLWVFFLKVSKCLGLFGVVRLFSAYFVGDFRLFTQPLRSTLGCFVSCGDHLTFLTPSSGTASLGLRTSTAGAELLAAAAGAELLAEPLGMSTSASPLLDAFSTDSTRSACHQHDALLLQTWHSSPRPSIRPTSSDTLRCAHVQPWPLSPICMQVHSCCNHT